MNHNLAYNIFYYRKEIKNLTQDELAEIMNVSRQAVAKWEAGESEPELSKLIKLSSLFGLTIDQLLFENNTSITSSDESTLHNDKIIEIAGFNVTSLLETILNIDPLDSILYTTYKDGLICEDTYFLYGTNPTPNHESLKNCILSMNDGKKRLKPFDLIIETTIPPSHMKSFIDWIKPNMDDFMIKTIFLIYEKNSHYNFKCRDLDLINYLEYGYQNPWEQLRKTFLLENFCGSFPVEQYYSQIKNTKYEHNMPYWFVYGFKE